MVDAADLKSAGYCNRAGSSPALDIFLIQFLFLHYNTIPSLHLSF